MAAKVGGLTLLELLFCLAILGILWGLAVPGTAIWLENNQGEKVMNELRRTLAYARHTAVTENTLVTFCPSAGGGECGGPWEAGAMVFTDYNGDREINQRDRLVLQLPALKYQGSLKFRSFQNRQSIQFTPLGFTNYQNGNFTFCPASKDAKMARQLIIHRNGRTRLAQDSDGDGYRENARGKALVCP